MASPFPRLCWGRERNHPFQDELETFTDDSAALAEDVGRIRAYPSLVHRDKVRAFLYELDSGALREIHFT